MLTLLKIILSAERIVNCLLPETDNNPLPLFFKIFYYICIMNMMYKFLDKHVGDTFSVVNVGDKKRHSYKIFSNRGVLVLHFIVSQLEFTLEECRIILFRGDELCKTVSMVFDLTIDESMMVIRNWFGDKLNLKRVGDLILFIPEEELVNS